MLEQVFLAAAEPEANRAWKSPPVAWSAKIVYLLTCALFKRAYAGYGMAADSVRRKESGTLTKMLLRTAVTVFNRYYREKRMRLHMTVMPTKFPELKNNSIQRS